MTDISRIHGGSPVQSSDFVTADQITIVGSGTTADPLRVAGVIGAQKPISIHGASFRSSVIPTQDPANLDTLTTVAGQAFIPQAGVDAEAFASIPLPEGSTISTIDVVVFIEDAVVIASLASCVDANTTTLIASSPASTVQPGLTVETLTINTGGIVLQPNTSYLIFVDSQIAGKTYTISRATINP